jgi:IS5 family transposase
VRLVEVPAYDEDLDCGFWVLRVAPDRQRCLVEALLPVGFAVLPDDLAAVDVLLADGEVYASVWELWRSQDQERGTAALTEGRPTIPIETFVRLIVLKVRNGWGYERLVREVSGSLQLRRFCEIGLGSRVADESTLRKLVHRLGRERVEAITRAVIERSAGQTGFRARAARVDSTVVEADIRFPTDAGLAYDGVVLLAREARRLAGVAGAGAPRVCDRGRGAKGRLRRLGRSLKRRSGEAKQEVLKITGECGDLLGKTVREAGRLVAHLEAGGEPQQAAAAALTVQLERCERVCEQIRLRLAGERISDRLVSLHDPDARPICKGKLAKKTEFGYVQQICEVTENTTGARGYVLPPSTAPGNPGEGELLPGTLTQLDKLGFKISELAVDGGFGASTTQTALDASDQTPKTVYVAGRNEPASPRTRRRLYRYRAGAEGRISHLKRDYGLRRSRLPGDTGQQTWCGWSILAYNLDTHAHRLN